DPETWILREPGIGRVTDSESRSVCWISGVGMAFMLGSARWMDRTGVRSWRRPHAPCTLGTPPGAGGRGGGAPRKASLRRYQPDQVPRDCLHRAPVPAPRGTPASAPIEPHLLRRRAAQGSARIARAWADTISRVEASLSNSENRPCA